MVWLRFLNLVPWLVFGIFAGHALAKDADEKPAEVEQKAAPSAVTALKPLPPSKPKRAAWNLSMEGANSHLRGLDGNDLIGTLATLQIGGGYFSQKWFAMGSADVILGPYDRARAENIKTDYNGTGFSAWTGYRLSGGSMRSNTWSYGLAAGAKYYELIGRSVSKSATEALGENDERYIDDYVIRIRNLALAPAIFLAWLREERSRGNSPDLLITRVEGFILMLGVSYSVDANFNAKYRRITREAGSSDEGDAKTVKQNGSLSGHSYLLSFSTLLGV